MEWIIVGFGLFVVFGGAILTFLMRFKRCPSDRILVVYGSVGTGRSARCYHGGATFVLPILQDYSYLDLRPMQIEIPLKGALSKQNIRVNAPAAFTIGISTEENFMGNAAERLPGLSREQVAELARDIIFGQMRVVIATMAIEEINADRDLLIQKISTSVTTELEKVGLKLINVNIQDVTDESGYIEALGREAASKAINDAKVKVSEAERDGEMGRAKAEKERKIYVAAANADAIKGENTAAIEVANSVSALRIREADAKRLSETAERVALANTEKDSYEAKRIAELARAEVERATRLASIVVPAEVEKKKIEVNAEAAAEQVKISANAEATSIRAVKQAQADGSRFQLEAEAKGLQARLEAEAQGTLAVLNSKAAGFEKMVAVSGTNPNVAILLMLAEQMPKLVDAQARAISNLKIDKITVWDSGGGKDGSSSTASFISNIVSALPPLHELAKRAGIDLPESLGKISTLEELNNIKNEVKPGPASPPVAG